MKSNFVRAGIAGALALALAACGGTEEYTISGKIAGLNHPGLVLSNNGKTISIPANATTFSFPDRVEYGSVYNVEVTPTGQPAHQTCKVFGGNGTAGQTLNVDILVNCQQNAYTIGGTVSGLTADGLVLANGTSGVLPVFKGLTTFNFGPNQMVADGSTYGVTVLTQPTGLHCTVANGVGTMGEANVTNMAVTCVPAT